MNLRGRAVGEFEAQHLFASFLFQRDRPGDCGGLFWSHFGHENGNAMGDFVAGFEVPRMGDIGTVKNVFAN